MRSVPILAIVAISLAPGSVAAQERITAPSSAAVAASPSPWRASAVGLTPRDARPTRNEAAVDATLADALRRRRGEGETLMIVGGAGILVGAVIDEGIVSVAGAVVGLYGLYLYLR